MNILGHSASIKLSKKETDPAIFHMPFKTLAVKQVGLYGLWFREETSKNSLKSFLNYLLIGSQTCKE